jgi:hypothetical protein
MDGTIKAAQLHNITVMAAIIARISQTSARRAKAASLVSTKLDHIRGRDKADDHNQLEMEFDSQREILTVKSAMSFAGIPQFDTDLIRAAGELESEKIGKIAEVAARVINSLIRFVTEQNETGGRRNFPDVVRHNILSIAESVVLQNNRNMISR